MTNRLRGLVLSRYMAIAHDLLVIPIAWLLAYWVRFNFHQIPPELLSVAFEYLWVVVPAQAATLWAFGLYRGIWRFASLPDLLRILKGSVFGLMLIMGILFVLYRLQDVPRSVPVLYLIFLVMMLSGPRLLYRWLKDRRFNIQGGRRVLIVGAGHAGEMLARDLLRDRHSFDPVAFVDDKVRRKGMEIHGIPVVGDCSAIPQLVKKLNIEVVVLAIPSATVDQRKRIIELCERTGIPFRTVPRLEHLMSGQVAINQLREVSIEDLLGREPVALAWDDIRAELEGKVVLVTGGGGSIGSELCRQLARFGLRELVIFENSEFNLYSMEMELRRRHPSLALFPILGDVRDEAAIDRVFSRFNPDVVFHAAAYKHVPMLEKQIREAVRNNVIGTRRMAEAADRYGCGKFVLISTDKAVNPANVMGATKRVAELFCQNLDAHSSTAFVTVRFGNVLGSAGSVVPLFQRQIEAGGPVTVTDREIERYFMTIPEACQLILQAEALGCGGEIFVLDMGKPVKIRYLAEQMIRLSGREPGGEIDIIYTGLRPGEKLYEELFHEQEALSETPHEKILLARHRHVDWKELYQSLDDMSNACDNYNVDALAVAIQRLVPENRMERIG